MSAERVYGMIEQRLADVRTRELMHQKTWLHANDPAASREAYTLMTACSAQVEALTWVLSMLDTIVHPPTPPQEDRSTTDLLVALFSAEPDAVNWSLGALAKRVGKSKTSVAKVKAKAIERKG